MYSTTRFAVYEGIKEQLPANAGFATKIGAAAAGGAIGGYFGVPADIVNVRMQNDIKLPPEKRRKYKHAIDGLIRIVREEGFNTLFKGSTVVVVRAAVVTVGQLSFYDQIKFLLIKSGLFGDNPQTHFTSSLLAATIATFISMPLDVVKTRAMNAKPGEFKNLLHVAADTAKQGPQAFFKGFIPAFIRIAPNTILIFVSLEQMIKYFGYDVPARD